MSTPATATSSVTDAPHRELIVCGPAATRVFELEDLATAGEIVVSAETARTVDPAWLGEERDGARLMTRLSPGASRIRPPPDVPGRELELYVPALFAPTWRWRAVRRSTGRCASRS